MSMPSFSRLLALSAFAALLALPARADIVLYQVNADLSALSGTGLLSLALNTNGTPDFNATASVFNFVLNGGTYGAGLATPATDVLSDESITVFGGTEPSRLFDIPVFSFGPSLSFSVAIDRSTPVGPSTDGWTFSLFAVQDDAPNNYELLLIDFAAEDDPVLTATSGVSASLVPEPSAVAVLSLAVGAVVFRLRRRRN